MKPLSAVCAPPPPWPCLFPSFIRYCPALVPPLVLDNRGLNKKTELLPTRSSNPGTCANSPLSRGPGTPCSLHATEPRGSGLRPSPEEQTPTGLTVVSIRIGHFNSCVSMSPHSRTHLSPSAHLGVSKTSSLPHTLLHTPTHPTPFTMFLPQPPAMFPGMLRPPPEGLPGGGVTFSYLKHQIRLELR